MSLPSIARGIDVERMRVPAERAAYACLAREEVRAQLTHTPWDRAESRRELLGRALLLTDTMAPDAYAAAREAMATLGVKDEIELFQSSDGSDGAFLVLDGGPIGVLFAGAALGRFDRGGLLAILGHEIGHALAHTGWAYYASRAGDTPTKRAYSMAAELTADRFGLLACLDVEAVLRLEMQWTAGESGSAVRFDTKAYLRQCCLVAEDIIAQGGIAVGKTHPEHYVRGYAHWLFSESDLYASISGIGSGSRSIQEVDDILHKLVGIRPQPIPVKPSFPIAPSPERFTTPTTRRVTDDPLEDERRDLLARFEELERWIGQ